MYSAHDCFNPFLDTSTIRLPRQTHLHLVLVPIAFIHHLHMVVRLRWLVFYHVDTQIRYAHLTFTKFKLFSVCLVCFLAVFVVVIYDFPLMNHINGLSFHRRPFQWCFLSHSWIKLVMTSLAVGNHSDGNLCGLWLTPAQFCPRCFIPGYCPKRVGFVNVRYLVALAFCHRCSLHSFGTLFF